MLSTRTKKNKKNSPPAYAIIMPYSRSAITFHDTKLYHDIIFREASYECYIKGPSELPLW